jgi:cbb3-type cytochrome oxidase subunit 3
MASITGAIMLIIVITVVFIVWMMSRQSKQTNAYGWRHNVLMDLKTGFECKLATDPLNPDKLINFNPNTQKPEVTRERGTFDKSDPNIPLGDDYWDSKGRYSGWRVIIKHPAEVIGKWINDRLIELERKNISLMNQLATKSARLIELENLIEQQFEKKIKTHEDMKKAAAIVIKDKK